MPRTFIFKDSEFFPQCHASTIAEMTNGSYISAWFAGSRESNPDTAIWSSTMHDEKWSDPEVIAKVGPVAHWNPVLFLDPEGILRLFFKVGESTENWETWTSIMDMATWKWSKPELLMNDGKEGGRGPVRGKIIVLPNGRWLAPASTEKFIGWTLIPNSFGTMYRRADMAWDSFIDISDDGGKTWNKSHIPYDRETFGDSGGIIQPSLWNTSGENVHVLLRSTHGCLFRSDSSDGGLTWSPAEDTIIPNPNSAVDVAQKSDGTLLLAYNPIAGDWVKRTPLSVSMSNGEGRRWEDPKKIEAGYGSYSYPFIIPTEKGFAMTYSWNRIGIRFIELGENHKLPQD